MIPLTTTVCQKRESKNESWQHLLAQAYRNPDELLQAINVKPDQIPGGLTTDHHFPLRVPKSYAARMEPGNPTDPLLLQVLSRQLETADQADFLLDPVGDGPSTVSPGLLHKYQGRVLLVTTGACPIHCRYCFRRHYPYSEGRPQKNDWSRAMAYIAADNSISEVILSGGDPLSLNNDRLMAITDKLANIPHIKRLRIHSRMPIVLPERINSGLLDWLGNLPWPTVMVLHSNHANEIDKQVINKLLKLKARGITLLNQSVLLKGVNDNAQALAKLSEALFKAGTLPYYLHMLDQVLGAAHFNVNETIAVDLINQLQRQLPGYLVPKLVREVAGEAHKVHIPAISEQ